MEEMCCCCIESKQSIWVYRMSINFARFMVNAYMFWGYGKRGLIEINYMRSLAISRGVLINKCNMPKYGCLL